MKSALIGKLLVFVAICSLSQISLAQDAPKTIAGILANMNHFASDAEKSTLMAIAADESNGRGIRAIATAVSNIQHAATAEDKELMGRIMAADQASPAAKALAEVVAGFSHMASDEAKATLASL